MQRNVKRNEGGMTAIVVGLLATTLIAATGLSVDVGNLMVQRQRLQTGVDNAALAIAQDCALRRATCSTSGSNPASSTAGLMVSQNIDGAVATVPGTVTSSTETVTVTATKSVPLSFASAIGIGPKIARATAKASWDQAPNEGYPLLPMAVGYCQYLANAFPADDHILIRTDLLSSAVKSVASILGLLGLQGFFGQRTCTSQTGGTLKMSDGAVWLTSLVTALDLFDVSNMSQCNMKVKVFTTMLVTTVTPVIAPTACVNKLKVGTVAMLPIYESASPLTVLSSSISMRIVGFAPFKITGWREPGNSKNDSSASPTCANIVIPLITSITCQGIQGYFVRSVVQDPDQVFAYDSSAPDLGGVRLTSKLTE
jgi:hypothetical protein